MNKLLHVNFLRLKKDKVFWIGMAVMFAVAAIFVLKNYEQYVNYQLTPSLKPLLFRYSMFIGIFSSIFCSLFLGVEYGDGTIRNKLVIGHRRSSIYLSNLIVNIAASLLMCLSYLASALLFGIPLIGLDDIPAKAAAITLLGSIGLVVAFCSIFTMISMLIQSRALAPVVCMITILVMFVTVMEVERRLSEPEFYPGYTYTDDSGNVLEVEDTPNPNYLRGTQREVHQFLYDLIPVGQSLQYSGMSFDHPVRMTVCDLVLILLTTGAGLVLFQKKDLK